MKKWEKAYDDYKQGMKYKDIASKYDVSLNTVKSWKSRYWNDIINNKSTPDKKGCTQNKKVAHKEKLQPVIKNDDLTEQQKMFCLFYLQHFNATKAYRQAYQVDYESAKTAGNRLLTNVHVKQELHRLKAELQQDIHVNTQDLIQEYVKQAFADITDYTEFGYDEYPVTDENGDEVIDEETGEVKTYKVSHVALKNSEEVDGTLIQEVKKGKDGVSVKLYDKQKAMQELTKLLTIDLKQQMDEVKLRELEAKTKIIENTADKLSNNAHVNELLEALVNPKIAD